MSERKLLIVACIPAYNEEKTIAGVVLRTMKYVDRVIVCDDGSSDLTGLIAERLGAEVIRHGRNLGYGAALSSLFRRAEELGADIAVTLDADGQHDPSYIPRLVEPIIKGEADIVIGSRFLSREEEKAVPAYRRLGIRVITWLTRRTSYKELTDAQSGFRAYSRRAVPFIIPSEMGMGASVEILLKARRAGLKIVEVPVRIEYGEETSTHNPLAHGMEVVLSLVKHHSIRHPLLFYGAPGFLALLASLGFWALTLQIFAATRQIATNIVIIALGATLIGLMLLTTAIILWVLVSLLSERACSRESPQ
ncbi:MAG: glycosyltransferase family 2 protein [Crenarchaeota archaeon]|nr:glycosyltransferase family 2 protein [Thermoproteota archaeon]